MEVDGLHWWFMKTMGEYATWTCVRVEVSVILGLELGQMKLNHFTGISCSPISVADFFKTYSPGSGGYWEVKELESWLG